MNAIAAIRRVLVLCFEAVAIVAFITMLLASLLQVFFRHVLNSPLMWTEELARLMLILATYFGSVVVLITREHIRVELIDGWVRGRSAMVLSVVVDVLLAWFFLSVAYGCWLMSRVTWATASATMDWFKTGYIYAAVGASVIAMTLIVLLDIYVRIRAGVTGEDAAA